MANRDCILAVLREIDADLQKHVRGDAFIIGSAAACLVGADVEALDLDLLTTADDAVRLEQAWALRRVAGYLPADGQLFRSRFTRYAFDAMPVEVMGDLRVCVGGVWKALTVRDAAPLHGYSSCLRVPSLAEQVRVLGLFGREKDRRRAGALDRLLERG